MRGNDPEARRSVETIRGRRIVLLIRSGGETAIEKLGFFCDVLRNGLAEG